MKRQTRIRIALALIAACYIAIPLAAGAMGINIRGTVLSHLPAWDTLCIIGWEESGREGKPRVRAANTP